MTLNDTLGHLQDAAWDHVASLPDSGALTNEQLAGWAQVARAAQPLLTALDRTDLMESLRRTAAAVPASPAARATADPTLAAIARNLQGAHEQLPPDEASRQNARDVVALVIQSTARTTATVGRDSHNPQVQTLSTELDATSREAHATVDDPRARAVPRTNEPPSRSTAAAPEPEEQYRTQERRTAMDRAPDGPSQHRGRSI